MPLGRMFETFDWTRPVECTRIFRLANSGEYIALTDGVAAVHELDLPNQFRDVAYGLNSVFDEFYFETTTPGTANTAGVLAVQGTRRFSVDRGFFDQPFETEITTATDGATIIYTLDGSPPSVLPNGTIVKGTPYTGSIAIAETTTLRAMAFKPGLRPTNVDTHTYIFPADVLQQSDADVPPHASWGHAGPDWEMDPEVVNLPQDHPDRVRESDLDGRALDFARDELGRYVRLIWHLPKW